MAAQRCLMYLLCCAFVYHAFRADLHGPPHKILAPPPKKSWLRRWIADATGFPADAELPIVPTAKRKRTQSCWLTASLVNSTLGHDHVVGQQVSQRELTKRAFFHVLDS